MTYFLAKWIKGARIVVDSSGVTTFQMLDLFLCFCFNWNKPSMLIKLRRKGKSRGRRPLLSWLLLKAKHCPWAQLERPVKHRRTKSNWTTSILQTSPSLHRAKVGPFPSNLKLPSNVLSTQGCAFLRACTNSKYWSHTHFYSTILSTVLYLSQLKVEEKILAFHIYFISWQSQYRHSLPPLQLVL